MNGSAWTLGTAVFLQIVAAVLVLRLGRLYGKRFLWALMATALVGIAFFLYDMFRVLVVSGEVRPILSLEFIGLLVSTVLFCAVLIFDSLIRTLLRAQTDLKAVAVTVERRSEKQLQSILDNSTAVIYVKDLTGKYILANRSFEKLFHVKRSQLTGKTDLDLFEPTFAERFMANDAKVATAAAAIEFEEVAPHDDGPHTYISLKFPLTDERNRVYAVCGISTDITDRKRQSEAVARLESFFSSIVENIPDMIFVKDARDLSFVLFNRAGEELLGYPREELLGKTDYDFFPKKEADCFTSRDREVLAHQKLEEILEEELHTRDKGIRILHTKKIPIRDKDGEPRYLLGISEDITEKKRAEQALLDKTAELARANAEREHLELFAYLASHDLQEPLQKVVGYAGMLRESAAKTALDEKSRGYLVRIEDAALRLSRLISDLLDFSRVATGFRRYEPIDLGEVAREALQDLELRISECGAKIKIGSLPAIEADRLQIRQLFQNLFSNAIKFRKPGTAPVISVTASELVGGAVAEIEVRDDGIGFLPAEAERIFKPFERLHGRDRFEGSGVGLAICRKIAERHGGRIQAISSPGNGSTFKLILPVSQIR